MIAAPSSAPAISRDGGDPLAQRDAHELGEELRDRGEQEDVEHRRFRDADLAGGPAEHEDVREVRAGDTGGRRADAEQHELAVLAEHLDDGQLHVLGRRAGPEELLRLRDRQPHDQRDDHQHGGDEERQAPAPRT